MDIAYFYEFWGASGPFVIDRSELGEEELEFYYCDTEPGQHCHHVHQQICNFITTTHIYRHIDIEPRVDILYQSHTSNQSAAFVYAVQYVLDKSSLCKC
mgnify:CR=1